jgi:hypothetical protein
MWWTTETPNKLLRGARRPIHQPTTIAEADQLIERIEGDLEQLASEQRNIQTALAEAHGTEPVTPESENIRDKAGELVREYSNRYRVIEETELRRAKAWRDWIVAARNRLLGEWQQERARRLKIKSFDLTPLREVVERLQDLERSEMRYVVGDHLFHCLESGRIALQVLAARQSDIEVNRDAMIRFGISPDVLDAIDRDEFPAEVTQLV